jgi:hypothetical protein
MPLGSVIRFRPGAGGGAQARVVDIGGRVDVPGPGADALFRVASETKGERGERYSFLKICVTRSLK